MSASNAAAILDMLAQGATCSKAQDSGGCCDGKGPFGKIFCGAVCIFCCMECEIGKLESSGLCFVCPEQQTEAPEVPIIAPYETVSVGSTFRFTASAYGRGLPILFGSDKLTGNVIWLGEFEDHKKLVGGTTYTYTTTSFAVAVCEGEINALLRLWLGSNILIDNRAKVDDEGVIIPGPSGVVQGYNIDLTDSDSPLRGLESPDRTTKITVFNGSTHQLPYGIMASTEGFDFSPAYRGVAYVLFENFIVTENSIPALEMEVSSNTVDLFPRVFGTLAPEETRLLPRRTGVMHYDLSYDLLYVAADKTSAPFNVGYLVYDANTLALITEALVLPDPDGIVNSTVPRNAQLLNNGLMLLQQGTGNAAVITSFNPLAGVGIETIAGPNFVHNTTGFGRWQQGSTSFRHTGSGGLPVDILCAPTADHSGGVGFMECTSEGKLKMLGYRNAIIPDSLYYCVYFPVPKGIADKYPTWSDTTPTEGTHVIVVSQRYSERERISLTRVSITAPYSIIDPGFTSMGTIDYDLLGGRGNECELYKAFQNPTDGMLILLLRGTNQQIVKYNPYDNTVVWRSRLIEPFATGLLPDDMTMVPAGNKIAYMSSTNKVVTVDLTDGMLETIIDDLAAQDLPPPLLGTTIYNGFENSLTYTSTQPGKEMVKVFLARHNRAQVTISTILTNLFNRVGWNNVNTVLSDLQTLSLDGYTIHNPTALRQIVSELKQVFTFDLIESNGKIVYKTRGSLPTITIQEHELGDQNGQGWLQEVHEPDFANSRKLSMTYRDLGREYENNVQSIILPKYSNDRLDNDSSISVQVPIVLEADVAKLLAEVLMYSKITYQTSYEFSLPPSRQNLDPGDVIKVETADEDIIMRLRQVSIGQDKSVQIQSVKEDPDIYRDQVRLFGNLGRYDDGTFDPLVSRLDPILLKMPGREQGEMQLSNTHSVFFTALNIRASALPQNSTAVNIDGDIYAVSPMTNFPTWGLVVDPLPYRSSYYSTDYDNTLRVKILSQTGSTIASATEDQLLANSAVNLAYVGAELLQFANAVHEGDGVYAFTVLNRCRFGTEPTSGSHRRGEYFVLLADNTGAFDTGAIRRVDATLVNSQRKTIQIDLKTNNPFQPRPVAFYAPTNLRPWIIGDFNYDYDGDEDLNISWQRRSRTDPSYADDGAFEQVATGDGPIEEYTLYILDDPGVFSFDDPNTYLRKVVVNTASFKYTQDAQIVDGIDNYNDDLYILINHSGSVTGSDPGAATQFLVQHKRV